MTYHTNTVPMAIMQPNPNQVVENFYAEGEPVLPKQPGEFTFFALQPIWSKDTKPFKPDTVGPDRWDTDNFIPGRDAPGPCVVMWVKVVRPKPGQSVLQPKKPGLITS